VLKITRPHFDLYAVTFLTSVISTCNSYSVQSIPPLTCLSSFLRAGQFITNLFRLGLIQIISPKFWKSVSEFDAEMFFGIVGTQLYGS